MRNLLVGGAVALALSMPVAASAQSQSEIDDLKAQVAEMNRKIADLESKESKSSWTDKIKLKGDFRYRFEYTDLEGNSDKRFRQRIRARIGVVGNVNDNTELGFGIRTGGANPRSGNVTLDGDSSTKDFGLDLGYAKWMPSDGAAVIFGKMKQPWASNAIDYFWDGDYNPEGLAVTYDFGGDFFVNGHWYQIDERGSDDDTAVWGGQFGYAGDLFYANVMYQDYLEMEGRNPCYQGDCNGNTQDDEGNLVYDYNILSVRGGVKVAGFNIFAAYAQNDDAVEDTAYAIGFTYGKAKDPGTWEIGAVYQDIEKDALYGGVVDADPGSSDTDFDGFSIKTGYALGKNWKAAVIYHSSTVSKTTNERDYDRIQLDFNWKY